MSNTPNDDFRPDMDLHEKLTPFDAMEQTGRRAMILLILSLGFLMVLALIVFKTYHPEGSRDRNTPPVISAENTPFKFTPDNPGGEITPDQDKEIYKAMDGDSSIGSVIPSPKAEVPITIPKSANIKVQATDPVKTVERVIPKPVPAPQTRSGSSDFVVQLASVRSREGAETIWNNLNTKFRNDLRPPLYADIKRTDLGDKGIFYRLRVAGFNSKTEATKLCDSLKGRQQACYITRK